VEEDDDEEEEEEEDCGGGAIFCKTAGSGIDKVSTTWG
jgi:hypothetical protein